MTTKEATYYQAIYSAFIGKKIVEVFYQELAYEANSEFWDLSENIHSVDLNVIFKLDNDELIQIIWDNEFYCYGIGFKKIDNIKCKQSVKTINLTQNKYWQQLIGKQITEVNVLWDMDKVTSTQYKNDKLIKTKDDIINLPQTWQLNFGNEKVWISALEIKDDGEVVYWANHLTNAFI